MYIFLKSKSVFKKCDLVLSINSYLHLLQSF